MRILLIEDDAMIGASLKRGLRDDGYAVDWLRDGIHAKGALADASAAYSLVILDWNLPPPDGLTILMDLRAAGHSVPVLMLTARADLKDRVAGLDGGADDYLTKPFELAELKARLRNLLRRKMHVTDGELSHGPLRLDVAAHAVHLAGTPVVLTPRELALLRAFMEKPRTVLSRVQLEEKLYGWDEAVESNAVEFIIHALRKKLGAAVIENIRGVGWRLRDTA